MKRLDVTAVQSVESVMDMEPERFKRLFLEYVQESDENSWEGFTLSQVSAIDSFLVDLVKYLTA